MIKKALLFHVTVTLIKHLFWFSISKDSLVSHKFPLLLTATSICLFECSMHVFTLIIYDIIQYLVLQICLLSKRPHIIQYSDFLSKLKHLASHPNNIISYFNSLANTTSVLLVLHVDQSLNQSFGVVLSVVWQVKMYHLYVKTFTVIIPDYT